MPWEQLEFLTKANEIIKIYSPTENRSRTYCLRNVCPNSTAEIYFWVNSWQKYTDKKEIRLYCPEWRMFLAYLNIRRKIFRNVLLNFCFRRVHSPQILDFQNDFFKCPTSGFTTKWSSSSLERSFFAARSCFANFRSVFGKNFVLFQNLLEITNAEVVGFIGTRNEWWLRIGESLVVYFSTNAIRNEDFH